MLNDKEEQILYEVAEDFQQKGYTLILCPRCNGNLQYQGNLSGYQIKCENACGIKLSCRGI